MNWQETSLGPISLAIGESGKREKRKMKNIKDDRLGETHRVLLMIDPANSGNWWIC
jgi:hypothetical protein